MIGMRPSYDPALPTHAYQCIVRNPPGANPNNSWHNPRVPAHPTNPICEREGVGGLGEGMYSDGE